ncbi:NVEALA domain-containing protein [Bacteroides helcogenes]|uniref:Secreted protein n=1 Tax=Bacteroides helcogenes (strain ATCC 35417 / DSM 20613 / JCM 6297 / CCUG 15421 / P 36-108) TaxID=693979 RepID=E6SNF9_BACT6|nr:NVEALA domain-containing protein [Bacteroides helcogenes]ADV42752.1 hypothetical protein Bache_0730 [Bacteroides helcogenes P 36-108]MDY5239584.1 NVEALA domain-containing protein [Bacteroides helcogenes]
MKNTLKITLLIVCVSFAGYNIAKTQESVPFFDTNLANIEVLGDEESLGCGGVATWVPNSYLGSSNCWNGGTHKKCKSMNRVCCNPAEQTDCKGVVSLGL